MTLRNLARIGATGALAVGALGLAATPALAADVDFGVKADDTTIAANADSKIVPFTVTNDGTTKPEKVEVVYDFSRVDAKKVKPLAEGDDCTGTTVVTCSLPREQVAAPGGSADAFVPVVVLPGAKGAAGTLTVTVKVAGDTNKANDSATFKVAIGDSGADLAVFADDVTAADAKNVPTGRPVAPGATAPLGVFIFNQGDMAAAGLTLQIKLPKQTTFGEVPGCTQSADKRTLTCTASASEVTLPRFDPKNSKTSLDVAFPVKVDADAKGPVSLKAGSVSVKALAQKPFSARLAPSEAALPEWASRPAAFRVAKVDVDLADNTDEFAVLVAGPAAGGGGSADNGGDNGDDNGGGLPLTGPAGYAIGGTGLAAIALGFGLFVAARRRRVVLVTPGDEK